MKTILCHLDQSLKQAMQQFSEFNVYDAVDHTKVIVNQLRGYSWQGLLNKAVGALTHASVQVMKRVCDEAVGENSRNTKSEGWSYARFLSCGQKLQVIRRTGKHTVNPRNPVSRTSRFVAVFQFSVFRLCRGFFSPQLSG